MKKALKLILMYILIVVLGIIFGVLFYSLYLGVRDCIAGRPLELFRKQDIINSFYFIAGCILIFICPVMVYIRIRNKGSVWHFVAYILLSIITWGVAFPSLIYFQDKSLAKIKSDKPVLSSGYFRENGDKVYYFTNEYEPAGAVTTVVIDKSVTGEVSVESIQYAPDFVLMENAAPYKDVLIKEAFSDYSIPAVVNLELIMKNAQRAMKDGITFYLAFLSLGLVLASLYGLAPLFDWKLMNTCILVFGTTIILIFNTFFYSPSFVLFRARYVDNKNFFIALSKYMNDPMLVLINIVSALIIIIAGIILFALKHKKHR